MTEPWDEDSPVKKKKHTTSKKTDDLQIINMLKQGKSPREISEYFGVGLANIYRRMGIMRKKGIVGAEPPNRTLAQVSIAPSVQETRVIVVETPPMALVRADAPVEQCINMSEQLQKINNYVNHELDKIKAELDSRPALEADPTWGLMNVGDQIRAKISEESLKKGWRVMLSKLAADVRDQLKLQLQVAEAMHDIREFYEFRTDVLEVLNSIDPKLKDQVIRKLRERKAIRSAVRTE